MKKHLTCLGLLAALGWLAGPPHTAVPAAEPTLRIAPQDGVLVLHNGDVLTGRITQAGDHYFVSIGGVELRLATGDVELFCENLDQAYELKRAAIEPDKVSDHLELAGWCIKQDLLGCAARELTDALALEPGHRGIGLLQRRLQQARRRPKPVAAVQQISDKRPTQADLDRMVEGLPPGGMEDFLRSVQPLLVNHCSTAGCHGRDSRNALRLFRSAPETPLSRRATQRNLHSVLAVTGDDAATSSLLTVPLEPHGGRAAVFGQQSKQYRELRDWVRRITRGRSPGESNDPPAAASTDGPPIGAAEPDLFPLELLTFEEQAAPRLRASMPRPRSSGSLDAELEELEEGVIEEEELPDELRRLDDDLPGGKRGRGNYVPVDPFDPEIFNRLE